VHRRHNRRLGDAPGQPGQHVRLGHVSVQQIDLAQADISTASWMERQGGSSCTGAMNTWQPPGSAAVNWLSKGHRQVM
jgi:hypothetical protein